ncbi:caspase domain-containing protein [Gautieria morchelliformis]|nr:caspase domain-containing protein [Gautieria morchelliformis]
MTTRQVPFFALVIGIDDYATVSRLSGATADADDMDSFLRNHLSVPKGHITNLRNKTATREGILQAFRKLKSNPEIKRDDAIFIYFAGHGSEANAPAGWPTAGSKIQVLMPQDVDVAGPSQSPIAPIPDRTLAALLNDMAREKGNNITVVLDCCHSSSGTRGDENVPERVPRVARFLHELPADLDNDLYPEEKGRNMNTPTAFLEQNLRSHILLAACGAEELAYENTKLGRGAFTTAFIQTLKTADVHKLTYMGFMDRLPNLPRQNPQCEGYHRDRMFFDAKLPGADRRFIGVEETHKTYKLKAGTAQGVTVDSEFTIHADHAHVSDNPAICRMRATEVYPFRTILEPIDTITAIKIPKPAYAREVRCGSGQELRVHFSEAFERVLSIQDVQQAGLSSNEPNFGFIVSDVDNAEMLVDIKDTSDGKCVVFSTMEQLATQYGYKQLPHEVKADPEIICRVLRGAARWNHHFKRTNHARFSGLVDLEFYRLDKTDGKFDELGMLVMLPANPDKNMNRTGVVDLVVKKDHFYGVKIVNNSKVDLYPYLFYFDLGDQCIEPYYLSQKGINRVDPPLRAGYTHTVGYGAGGEVPFAFHLPNGQAIDVGFLKLFLTTSPMDFDSMTQSSPFDTARAALPRADTIQKLKQAAAESAEQWGTVVTAIIQRSDPRSPEAHPQIPSEATQIPVSVPSIPLKDASSLPSTSPSLKPAPECPTDGPDASPTPPLTVESRSLLKVLLAYISNFFKFCFRVNRSSPM